MQEQTVVLASTNQGKLRELAPALSRFGLKLLGLEHFPELGEIEENGTSFEENALIKARTVAGATGFLSLADDSGLEVDALDGAPGIHSARYGADFPALPGESRDARNIRKLLLAMAKVPKARRVCRFVCAMAAVRPNGAELCVRGTWEGYLLDAPRGSQGFGYDPVFCDPQSGLSAAELSRAEKNSRSHRGKALAALLERWPSFA